MYARMREESHTSEKYNHVKESDFTGFSMWVTLSEVSGILLSWVSKAWRMLLLWNLLQISLWSSWDCTLRGLSKIRKPIAINWPGEKKEGEIWYVMQTAVWWKNQTAPETMHYRTRKSFPNRNGSEQQGFFSFYGRRRSEEMERTILEALVFFISGPASLWKLLKLWGAIMS